MEISSHQSFKVINAIFQASIALNTWLFCEFRLTNEKFGEFFLSFSTKNQYINLLNYLNDCESFIFLTRLMLLVFESTKSASTEAMFKYLKDQGFHEFLSKYEDISTFNC